MDAQRVRKRFVWQLLDGREGFFEQRELLNPLERERPHLAIFRNVREQVKRALGIRQAIRMDDVLFRAIA